MTARRPPSSRLKGRRLIRPLFDRSRGDVMRFSASSVRILARLTEPDPHGSPAKLGVAVGRRAGRAVDRSRIRRLLRESIRHQIAAVQERVPGDCLLTAVLLYRGNKDDMRRVRADADRALSMLVEHLGIAHA